MSIPWIIHCPPGVDPSKLSVDQTRAIMVALPGEHGVLLVPYMDGDGELSVSKFAGTFNWALSPEGAQGKTCGATNGKRGKIPCEVSYPHPAQWARWHTGRDRRGYWWTWEVRPGDRAESPDPAE